MVKQYISNVFKTANSFWLQTSWRKEIFSKGTNSLQMQEFLPALEPIWLAKRCFRNTDPNNFHVIMRRHCIHPSSLSIAVHSITCRKSNEADVRWVADCSMEYWGLFGPQRIWRMCAGPIAVNRNLKSKVRWLKLHSRNCSGFDKLQEIYANQSEII